MRQNIFVRFFIFILERFSPFTHLLLISIFYSGTIVFYKNVINIQYPSLYKIVIGFLNVFLIFLNLRLLDEIKDYKTDIIVHPERPLARGLITIKEAKIISIVIIGIELIFSLLISPLNTLFLSVVILFSFLMFKEFFVSEFLNKHIYLYAFTHNPITALIIIYGYSIFPKINIDIPLLLLIIIGCLQALVFEFARKILILEYEKKGMPTYSSSIGFVKSILVTLFFFMIQSFLVLYIARILSFNILYYIINGIYISFYIFISLLYIFKRIKIVMKIYEYSSAFYIIIFNISIILEMICRV
ncbi:MAG TPA: UbiA family prenyltransferase [Spirochaetota bacterium]|nr:UbiA family prenyltransferase [Spirochaetota bacterium]